jgi:predicted choloylglycine hydrolase
MYEALRWFVSRLTHYTSKLAEINRIIHYIDGLTTPDNETIMDALDAQRKALLADKADFTKDAISDFRNIVRERATSSQIFIEDDDKSVVALIRIYDDAVVIIEDTRTLYYMSDNNLEHIPFSSSLELYLESGCLMANYNFIPF